ncbi:HD domain-containing phosphohydrolase [Hippea jasoniae]|uniref:HD domain-containing phosphohydrolase n=1 Tax=Hippea jasoniae TaxID=944479 RepID=UPI00068ABB93|nr:HD domain-containing phosphohydrolase [Hippea jasoniae]
MKTDKLFELIKDIHAGAFQQKGWPYILKKIEEFFGVDVAFFGHFEDEEFICSTSNGNISCKVDNCEAKVSEYVMKTRQPVILVDYKTSKYASKFWIEKGIESLVAVPVFYDGDIFGVLQITSFKKRRFSKGVLLKLESIASILSFVLYNLKKLSSRQTLLDLMIHEFEFFYSQKLPDFFNEDELKKWIVDYLKNILKITNSQAVGFIFPREEIFVAVGKTDGEETYYVYFSKSSPPKDWILYQIWEKQIRDVVLYSELDKFSINISEMAQKLDIKEGLFVPVTHEGEIVVAMGFGFDKKIDIDKDYKLALQNSATHLAFMLIAAKNLSILSNELIDVEESFLESFVLMMEARDSYTKGHSKRVAYYAKKIAQALGLDAKQQEKIYLSGLLHDVGKIGIPDNILLKPGKLTPNEYNIIKYHAEFSYKIIKNIKRFEDIAYFVRYHHERCDGSGYPKGLLCHDIPVGARILAIADVFDAITTTRPYRKKLSPQRALEVLEEMKGQLDRDIVEKASDVLKEGYKELQDMEEARAFMPLTVENIRMQIFTTDYMTGLLRRKQFVDAVNELIKAQERFCVFYIDIKNLSYINYSYSMEVGDKIILYTADILKNIKEVEYLARTEPDAFYFVYKGKVDYGLYATLLKRRIKDYVIDRLAKEEMMLGSFKKLIDYYVAFAEYIPGKGVEDLMYECKKRKKEIEELLYD